MVNLITITIIKSLVLEAVKNETYLRGQADKAADTNAAALAYHRQAGNEQYHERILERAFCTNLEDLKTQFSDYLTDSGQSSADNIYSTEQNDTVVIHLKVSDRFNKGYTQSLARLSSKYIEESMLMDWWKAIDKEQSKLYAQFVEKDLASIRRCFNKTAPTMPTVPYPSTLEITGSAIELAIGEEQTVTYTINDGAIDDIELRLSDGIICSAGRSADGFNIRGERLGHTTVLLYSRHNEALSQLLHVYVTNHR